MTNQTPFDEWALLELMGHNRYAGRVSEQVVAGAALIRLDVYESGGTDPVMTQFYSPNALYCITPISETMAREFANQNKPHPIAQYELAQKAPPALTYGEEE